MYPAKQYTLGYAESMRGAKWVAQKPTDPTFPPQLQTLPRDDNWDRSAHFMSPGEWVITTGYYYYWDDVIYMQTTSGIWYIVTGRNAPDDWVRYKDAVNIPEYSRDDTQRMVNGIIENNIHIVENNLLCARFADKFTPEQRKQIAELQKRVQERWDAIKNDGYCEDIQESYPKGYADLEPYLAQLMKTEGIGIVWWAACIIVAIVIGGLGAAAYFVYRDLFQESKEDVKYSDELTKILQEKLTEEEYQQLLNETQGIITKAKIRAKLGSYGTVLKVAGILVAGALAYKFIFR